jgi:hypothetical protein
MQQNGAALWGEHPTAFSVHEPRPWSLVWSTVSENGGRELRRVNGDPGEMATLGRTEVDSSYPSYLSHT